MSGAMASIREKMGMKRTWSHKDKEIPEDAESADEETQAQINKEYEEAEKEDKHPLGRPGGVLNRMISHGNKRTEDQLAREAAEAEAARQARVAGTASTGQPAR